MSFFDTGLRTLNKSPTSLTKLLPRGRGEGMGKCIGRSAAAIEGNV